MSLNPRWTRWVKDVPVGRDIFFLLTFATLITWQPFYLQQKLNLYELGLYLPGIDAILKGHIPFRDFFHLRGPLELYLPAALMKMFGDHVAVLSTYFYAGTVLTLWLCVLLAKEFCRTRVIFYLMVLVLIARTFPRVVFTYWGGMRYAIGLLALWFAVKYFKEGRAHWMFWAGVGSSLSLLTSVEIGACSILGVVLGFLFAFFAKTHERKPLLKGALRYAGGILAVAVPYLIFLVATNSLGPYLESVWTVVTRMEKVINLNFISEIPNNSGEALGAMINPASANFKQMTPGYCYLAWAFYLIFFFRQKSLTRIDTAVVCLGGYGLVMYNTAFRAIQGSQFEMALQPEKILYFFLIERVLIFSWERFRGKFFVNAFKICLAVVFLSSLGYAIQRYNHRFYAFKFVRNVLMGKNTELLKPLAGYKTEILQLKRAKGVTVPAEQAQEIMDVVGFFDENTSPGETVFMFPELGSYHFFADRPFVGRFPMVTFSWFKDQWHEELLTVLKKTLPRYAVLLKDLGPWFPDVYFKIPKNKAMYDEVRDLVLKYYRPVRETSSLMIYRLKSSSTDVTKP